MNNKERFELEALPERIEALEAEQEQLYVQMSEPAFYRNEGDEVAQVGPAGAATAPEGEDHVKAQASLGCNRNIIPPLVQVKARLGASAQALETAYKRWKMLEQLR